MNPIIRHLEDAARKPILAGLAMYASLIGITFSALAYVYDLIPRSSVSLVAAGVSISLTSVLIFVGFYTLFEANARLRSIPRELHAINHIYRNCLAKHFYSIPGNATPTPVPAADPKKLLEAEQQTLREVAQKVASIMTNAVGRKCIVTIKLLVSDAGGKSCTTYARSEQDNLRDQDLARRFKVGSGDNTGFDEALLVKGNGTCHFHASDLVALRDIGKYCNERQGWEILYRSTIVIPIRWTIDRQTPKTDDIGFLCVDTMSEHRLNAKEHVELMAAFADQMYNFMSLMRRRYALDHQGHSSVAC